MPTKPVVFELPNDAAIVHKNVKDGFPGGWAWVCRKVGIDPSFPSKWAESDEKQRRVMPVEMLALTATYLLERWPNRGADIAEALVGHIVAACGCRIVPNVDSDDGEEAFDDAADASARFTDWHRSARHPKSPGGTAITAEERRAARPILREALREFEEADAAVPESGQGVLPMAARGVRS